MWVAEAHLETGNPRTKKGLGKCAKDTEGCNHSGCNISLAQVGKRGCGEVVPAERCSFPYLLWDVCITSCRLTWGESKIKGNFHAGDCLGASTPPLSPKICIRQTRAQEPFHLLQSNDLLSHSRGTNTSRHAFPQRSAGFLLVIWAFPSPEPGSFHTYSYDLYLHCGQ